MGWQMLSSPMPTDTRQFMSAFFEVAGDPDPVTATLSFMTRQLLLRAWGECQETRPLIVAPIFTGIPFEAGTDLADSQVAHTVRGMRMALAISALGLPAVALPVGIGDGLPQSVQVIGPRYREDLCLDAAAALEDRLGIITPIDPQVATTGQQLFCGLAGEGSRQVDWTGRAHRQALSSPRGREPSSRAGVTLGGLSAVGLGTKASSVRG
jgi:amidase